MSESFSAFGDESGTNDQANYVSIALISGYKDAIDKLTTALIELKPSSITEMKFYNLNGPNSPYTQYAKESLKTCLNSFISHNIIKVEVLTANKNCNIPCAELISRMYYKAILNAREYWIYPGCQFYPDRLSSMDWDKLKEIFQNTNILKSSEPLFTPITCIQPVGYHNSTFMPQIQECDSKETPLIQLADIFAGIVRISYENKINNRYKRKQLVQKEQSNMFNHFKLKNDIPKNHHNSMVNYLHDLCKDNKLSVSLRDGYLNSVFPKKPLNFSEHIPNIDY
ncbi:MAG: DUF3800 domain-containing protein [Dehalococcoides mccartyi]|uniref:DUF3800 domain-containing protein n=1 Tax=Dehalococcoides mccartyi TaxID=61435 RepID=UPI0030FC7D2B